MDEGKLRKVIMVIPLAIAAGYFIFLIATWSVFLKQQQEQKAKFDERLDRWLAEKTATDNDVN